MIEGEPATTALLLTVAGILLVTSALFSSTAQRIGVPVVLLFLVIGMLAGEEGIGGLVFDDFDLAFRLGIAALVLILFDGGLNTPIAAVREAIRPAAVLATIGVLGTAAAVAVCAYVLGFGWPEALLLGAIVSSTDAAAVFAVLRGSGLHLKRRVGVTLEIESGSNDPMAVILTTAFAASIAGTGELSAWIALDIVLQLAIGGALGAAFGFGGRLLLSQVRLDTAGLYPVLTLALALLAFGVPTIFFGSGFLAVYVAAVIIGNGRIPYRSGLLRIHDAIAWLAQITMFLVLGLLVFPSMLLGVAWEGLILGLFLGLVGRPLVVTLCLLPFRYPIREQAYISWIGLRGAVPIILGTFPVLMNIEGAVEIFHVVFFVVVVSALVPGGTVRWVTRKLGLEADEPPPPPAVLEIQSTQLLDGEILSYYVDRASVVCGSRVADLPFPEGSSVLLVVRGRELLAPSGDTILSPGDHVYVFCKPEQRGLIELLFGQREAS